MSVLPELGALGDVLAKQVTGGDVLDRQMLGKAHGLRALAGTGRPYQQDAHR